MNLLRYLLIAFLLIPDLHAADKPIEIATEHFLPPFVMEGPKHESYGFDIEMMQSLCKIMNRSCHFHAMQFDELLPAVQDKKMDIAVSFITITPERAKLVNFSIPYLLSYSRFLTKRTTNDEKTPFNLEALNDKKIGVVSGTIFLDQIKSMNITSPVIKQYNSTINLIEALNSGDVDYILVNQQSALYWEANSANSFIAIGEPYIYGYGVGIAVNQNERELLLTINKALVEYQASAEFKRNYNKFIVEF